MIVNFGPKFRSFVTRHSNWFFGLVLFVLITLLFVDRYFHNKVEESFRNLGTFLELQGQTDLLTRVPTSHPQVQLIPEWVTSLEACDQQQAIKLSYTVAMAYIFNQQEVPTPTFLEDLKLFERAIKADFETLPVTLSKTFVALNRFIQRKRGFDKVEDHLRILIPKLENRNAEGPPEFVPPSLVVDLLEIQRKYLALACFWHQPLPLMSGWIFREPLKNEKHALFPPEPLKKMEENPLEKYFKLTRFSSPFPLWYQKELPSEQIREDYIVVNAPKMGNLSWLTHFQSFEKTIDHKIYKITAKDAKILKTVTWQLKNLTRTIDRAARFTPPDANAVFAETIGPLNMRLNQIETDERPRWERLAQELLRQDMEVVAHIQNIRNHEMFRTRPKQLIHFKNEWYSHWNKYFQEFPFWVFPKRNLSPLQRLNAIEDQLAATPNIYLSPETPWLYWWIKGRPLRYATHFFYWRQLLIGVGVGMTLLLWTLKKMYFS